MAGSREGSLEVYIRTAMDGYHEAVSRTRESIIQPPTLKELLESMGPYLDETGKVGSDGVKARLVRAITVYAEIAKTPLVTAKAS